MPKSTTAFLERKGVNTLQWPASSPDMSLIENMWDYIGDKVANDIPASTEILWKSVQFHWYNIDENYLCGLYVVMSKKV